MFPNLMGNLRGHPSPQAPPQAAPGPTAAAVALTVRATPAPHPGPSAGGPVDLTGIEQDASFGGRQLPKNSVAEHKGPLLKGAVDAPEELQPQESQRRRSRWDEVHAPRIVNVGYMMGSPSVSTSSWDYTFGRI